MRNMERLMHLIRSGQMAQADSDELIDLHQVYELHLGARVMRPRTARRVPVWRGQSVARLVVAPYSVAQGLGDFFQYARFVRPARARCGHVTLVCHEALQHVARRCAGADDVVTIAQAERAWNAADACAPLFLPLAGAVGAGYGTPLSTPPIPDRLVELAPGVRHIGLCWRASPVSGRDRSIPFWALHPLQALLPGVQFHSLQLQPQNAARLPCAWASSVRAHALRDWDDTIGLIAALDAVVTVSTAVAVVAGNLGVSTHVLAHGDACGAALWGPGSSTPWWPSWRLHRGSVAQCIESAGRALGATC